MNIYLFTYGSLKFGERNNILLDGQEYASTGFITGYDLYDLGSFPGIVPGEPNKYFNAKVNGELWLVDEEFLIELDFFEGSTYSRERIVVETPNGQVSAYVYVYIGDLTEATICGDSWSGVYESD